MRDSSLDAVDGAILYLLQENARQSITDIADRVNVSGNTVRNRIDRLEERGVIRGYSVDLDYNRTDIQHHFQFVCTARINDREPLANRALEVPGVLEVRTLMTGVRNVLVRAAGLDNDDITRIALALDEMGLRIEQESLVRQQRYRPLDAFRSEQTVE